MRLRYCYFIKQNRKHIQISTKEPMNLNLLGGQALEKKWYEAHTVYTTERRPCDRTTCFQPGLQWKKKIKKKNNYYR